MAHHYHQHCHYHLHRHLLLHQSFINCIKFPHSKGLFLQYLFGWWKKYDNFRGQIKWVFLVLVKIHKTAYTVLPSSFLMACILCLCCHLLILRFLSFVCLFVCFFWGAIQFLKAHLEGSWPFSFPSKGSKHFVVLSDGFYQPTTFCHSPGGWGMWTHIRVRPMQV